MKRLIGVIVGCLLLVGCTGLAQPSAEEIVRRAEAAMEKLDRAYAVIEIEATIEGETMRVVGEGWMQDEQARLAILEASEEKLVGAMLVSDGATGWLSHPAHAQVLTGDLEALKAYREAEGEADLPAELDVKGLTEAVDELLRITNEELVGSETIAGQDTWHLRLTPNAEAPAELSAAGGVVELWIAKASDLPMQVTYTGGTFGEGRITVREFEAAPTFPAGLFTFTPPASAEVVDVATLLPERLTLPEAREQAGFPLLTLPSDSAEAALVGVTRAQAMIVQEFDGTLGEWSLTQSATKPADSHHDAAPAAFGETVKLRGTDALLFSDSDKGITMLLWKENGIYTLISGPFAPETALKLAEALE